MFEHDHSAARGKMAVRELIVFKHSKELGDCPAYKLFDAVEVKTERRSGISAQLSGLHRYRYTRKTRFLILWK
jgi:hypothetical protein